MPEPALTIEQHLAAQRAEAQQKLVADRAKEQADALAEAEAARLREYGMYIATGPIPVGSALAYNTGDPVPISNVEAHGYLEAGLVVRVGEEPEPEAPPASGPALDAPAAKVTTTKAKG